MNDTATSHEDGRSRRARVRREETHQMLVNAARIAFAQEGYAHTSPKTIAAMAKVSRATFYQHFRGKSEAFTAVFEDLLVRLEDAVLGVELGEEEAPPYEQLIDNLMRVLNILLERHEIARLLVFGTMGHDAAFGDRVEALFDHILEMIVRSLSQGREAGLVRDVAPEIVGVAILGSIKEVLGRCLSPNNKEVPTEDRAHIARELLGYNLRGVATPALLASEEEEEASTSKP